MSTSSQRRAMLLVITGDDIFGRTLETLFAPAGYHVVRVRTVDEAVQDARAQGPDVVILHADLLRADAARTCARLRELPEVGYRTPLVVSSTTPLSQAERRDALRQHLSGKGIGSAVYYPTPLHLQPCFSGLGYKAGQLPRSECAAREVLSLPVYPELSAAQQDEVIAALRSFAA